MEAIRGIRPLPSNCMCGFELKRGQVWGPKLTSGRTWDHQSPFKQEVVQPGSLSIHDLGYFDLRQMGKRRRAGGYSLSRLHAGTALFTPQGKPLNLHTVLPRRVGHLKEMHVLVGARERLPMRLLLVRVPKEVADERREDLRRDAQRRQQPLRGENPVANPSRLVLPITKAPAHSRRAMTVASVEG